MIESDILYRRVDRACGKSQKVVSDNLQNGRPWSDAVWKRFDHRNLDPLKYAIIRRRRVLALQLWP
jgi:hypothetical protein